MEIEHKNTDQNWQEQSTTYWFDVDGESFGLCDKGYGGETRLLDCDGCPVEECNDMGGIWGTLQAMAYLMEKNDDLQKAEMHRLQREV